MDSALFDFVLNQPPEPKIVIGAEYRLRISLYGEFPTVRKWRAVGKYKHHVVFDYDGVRQAVDWWTLARVIV